MSSKNSVFFSQPISTAVHDTTNSSKSLGGAKFQISFPFRQLPFYVVKLFS